MRTTEYDDVLRPGDAVGTSIVTHQGKTSQSVAVRCARCHVTETFPNRESARRNGWRSREAEGFAWHCPRCAHSLFKGEGFVEYTSAHMIVPGASRVTERAGGDIFHVRCEECEGLGGFVNSALAEHAGWVRGDDGRWRCAGCAPDHEGEGADRNRALADLFLAEVRRELSDEQVHRMQAERVIASLEDYLAIKGDAAMRERVAVELVRTIRSYRTAYPKA